MIALLIDCHTSEQSGGRVVGDTPSARGPSWRPGAHSYLFARTWAELREYVFRVSEMPCVASSRRLLSGLRVNFPAM